MGIPSGKSAERHDPLAAFFFSLQITGVIDEASTAFFKSVSGLKSESEVVPYREGGLNSFTHQLVGATKWPNLVLKRGFARGGYQLLQWRQSWLDDSSNKKRVRRAGKIIQYDSQKHAVCSWEFVDGWPCKWEGPDYDASKTELAIESIEIAHSGLFFRPSG
jgi:phage tail-like protein